MLTAICTGLVALTVVAAMVASADDEPFAVTGTNATTIPSPRVCTDALMYATDCARDAHRMLHSHGTHHTTHGGSSGEGGSSGSSAASAVPSAVATASLILAHRPPIVANVEVVTLNGRYDVTRPLQMCETMSVSDNVPAYPGEFLAICSHDRLHFWPIFGAMLGSAILLLLLYVCISASCGGDHALL
jgi:hypothetical protein